MVAKTPDWYMRYIGNQVRQLRVANGFSQKDLSRELNCSHDYFWRIENGTTVPTIHFLVALAYRFEVDIASFFPGPATKKANDTV